MSDDGRLYMTKLTVSQPDLMRLGKEKGLPMQEVDLGYLVHCLLGEVFGDHAPQPFDIRDTTGRRLELLAYCRRSADQLRQHADAFADPERHESVDWERFHQKTMPDSWPEGLELSFEVRVCPVVRAANDTEHYSQGSEVDVFLTRCAESDDDEAVPGREQVYRDWLADQLQRRGGAELQEVGMEAFQLRKLTRRRQGPERTARVFTRPDARMRGRLRVGDPEQFQNVLGAGVGRHRAFGFGMLLLRPSR